LADHTKFCPPAFFEVARLEDAVHDLITDDLARPDALEQAGASGRPRIHVV
jgi:DeoR/GlpR family transcriptional regulator of sugar metabolism